MGKIRNTQLIKDAVEASNHRTAKKIVISVVSMLLVLFLAGYIALSLYDYHGSLTVTVGREQESGKYSLILSEDRNFNKPSPKISAKQVPDITNMAGEDIPADVDSFDGQHNGENYFAYTFYLMNNGTDSFSYLYNMTIVEVQQDVDRGIRIRLYKNGVPTTYARPATNGDPEPNTTPFLKIDTIMEDKRLAFNPNDVDKFTVVMWIEGNDPDTVDALIGGSMKIKMEFTVA